MNVEEDGDNSVGSIVCCSSSTLVFWKKTVLTVWVKNVLSVLVLANPDCPGKGAVKWFLVSCT